MISNKSRNPRTTLHTIMNIFISQSDLLKEKNSVHYCPFICLVFAVSLYLFLTLHFAFFKTPSFSFLLFKFFQIHKDRLHDDVRHKNMLHVEVVGNRDADVVMYCLTADKPQTC